jgi:hypothetical protein
VVTLGEGEPAAGPWRVEPLTGFAKLLIDAARAPNGRPVIVAFDGRSSSGESTLTSRLARPQIFWTWRYGCRRIWR